MVDLLFLHLSMVNAVQLKIKVKAVYSSLLTTHLMETLSGVEPMTSGL